MIGGVKLDMVGRLASEADEDDDDEDWLVHLVHLKIERTMAAGWDEKLTTGAWCWMYIVQELAKM